MLFKPWVYPRKGETIAAAALRQIGHYAFVRMCRNSGMSFEDTYFLVFGRFPPR